MPTSVWSETAAVFEQIGMTLNGFRSTPGVWTADSPAAAEARADTTTVPLPVQQRAVTAALMSPFTPLTLAQDFFFGAAAILRSERSQLALMPVLRPLVVACAQAGYLADGSIDGRERIRRTMNARLASDTELLNYFQGQEPGHGQYESRRRNYIAAAQQMAFPVTHPEKKGTSRVWRDWWVGDKPPSEMVLIRLVFREVRDREVADSLYRLLSAFVHVQPYAIESMLLTDQAVSSLVDGYVNVPISMSPDRLLTFAAAAGAAANLAIVRCANLYGWDLTRWSHGGFDAVAAWIEHLEALARQQYPEAYRDEPGAPT